MSGRDRQSMSALRTVYILAERQEALLVPGQLGEGIVGGVWLDAEGHVAAIAVEVPDKGRVTCKCLWCGERRRVVGAPQAASSSERGQPRRG